MSAVGDWLGLLATGLFAANHVSGATAQGAAFGGVVLAQLLPALVFGPLSGAVADRWDRRTTMVACDVLRFALCASIPASLAIMGRTPAVVAWAIAATFLAQLCAMLWAPAKEAAVPNLVRGRLEEANQLSLVTTYGVAPVLAALLLAAFGRLFPNRFLHITSPELALYFNALTFLAAAIVVATVPGLGRSTTSDRGAERQVGVVAEIAVGWRYAVGTRLLRGLVLGVVGAFAAGGVVIGAAPFYAASLGGGEASFGLLFAALFVGLGIGMALGPRLVGSLSRYRWFGMSVVLAGAAVATLAVAPHLAVAVAVAALVGIGAGMAFLSGTTLLGTEVEDAMRGRMFAFVQTAVRVVLMLAVAVGSLFAGIGGVRAFTAGPFTVHVSASRGLLFVSGLLAVYVGVTAFGLMDDKRGTRVLPDLLAAVLRHDTPPRQARPGVLVALVGKADDVYATEIRALLRARGYECDLVDADAAAREQDLPVVGEPFLGPRAATLIRLAAVARSNARDVLPALARGSVAIIHGTGFPVPTSGTGHDEAATFEFSQLLRWATGGRTADVLVVVDPHRRPGDRATWPFGGADRRSPRVVTVCDDPDAAARTVLAALSQVGAAPAAARSLSPAAPGV